MNCILRLTFAFACLSASGIAEPVVKPPVVNPAVATVSGITATTAVPKQLAAKDKLEVEMTFTMAINYTYVFNFSSVSFTLSNISTGENFIAHPQLLPYRDVDRVPYSDQAMKTINALPDIVHYDTERDAKTGKKMLVVYRCMYLNPSESHTLTMPLTSFDQQSEPKATVKKLPPGIYNVTTKFACQGKTGKAASAISWWASTGQMVTTMEVTK